MVNELCDVKTGLNIFVMVIPKEGMAGNIPAKPSFGMTTTIELYFVLDSHQRLYFIVALGEDRVYVPSAMYFL